MGFRCAVERCVVLDECSVQKYGQVFVVALRIYKRIGLTYQAQRRDQMLQAEIDVHNSTRRTEVGDEEARNDHGDLNALADALENEEA